MEKQDQGGQRRASIKLRKYAPGTLVSELFDLHFMSRYIVKDIWQTNGRGFYVDELKGMAYSTLS